MGLTEREKDHARSKARWAFPVLTKCEHCPATERLERHHPNLSEPLAVIVLCKACHVAEHQRTGGFGGAQNARYPSLAHLIRERILSGEYATGRRIPSIEQFCLETGHAPRTIRQGIRLLVDEGWLLISPGKGTFVNPPEMWPKE